MTIPILDPVPIWHDYSILPSVSVYCYQMRVILLFLKAMTIMKPTEKQTMEEYLEKVKQEQSKEIASQSDEYYDQEMLKDEKAQTDSIPGLDAYTFVWDRRHPLRKVFIKTKRDFYIRYDALNPENVDLRVIVDQVIMAYVQYQGLFRMSKRDGTNARNTAYRLSKHTQNMSNLLALLMKYTRKEGKDLNVQQASNAKKTADALKSTLSPAMRERLARSIREANPRAKQIPEDEDEFEDFPTETPETMEE